MTVVRGGSVVRAACAEWPRPRARPAALDSRALPPGAGWAPDRGFFLGQAARGCSQWKLQTRLERCVNTDYLLPQRFLCGRLFQLGRLIPTCLSTQTSYPDIRKLLKSNAWSCLSSPGLAWVAWSCLIEGPRETRALCSSCLGVTCSRSCSLMLQASVLPVLGLRSRHGRGSWGAPSVYLSDAGSRRSDSQVTAHLNARSLPVLPGGLRVQAGGAWGKKGVCLLTNWILGSPGPLQGAWPEQGAACPLGAL